MCSPVCAALGECLVRRRRQEGDSRRTSCRYDWHQTGSHVTVAVYAKLCRPDQCRVQASAVRLRPHLVFGEQQLFEVDLELAGVSGMGRRGAGVGPWSSTA